MAYCHRCYNNHSKNTDKVATIAVSTPRTRQTRNIGQPLSAAHSITETFWFCSFSYHTTNQALARKIKSRHNYPTTSNSTLRGTH
ncbi:uncharacterized protein YALI1_F32685g [Yarrowia lipolytica]|uniref:Uncharacterized protein n=1 Tax=Yarrowia lipolytica TaxID=4952 RepID=A0A1D8NPX8_YARLL|nr:hypothetical protein YALI1_F32685g [Yarrowia lipolytica]